MLATNLERVMMVFICLILGLVSIVVFIFAGLSRTVGNTCRHWLGRM